MQAEITGNRKSPSPGGISRIQPGTLLIIPYARIFPVSVIEPKAFQKNIRMTFKCHLVELVSTDIRFGSNDSFQRFKTAHDEEALKSRIPESGGRSVLRKTHPYSIALATTWGYGN
jgi:hypothetical protein